MNQLPNGVDEIVEFLALAAEGYDNHLKWNEVAMFKADLMNVPDRWLVIDPDVFEAACLRAGMREEDAADLAGFLRMRKQGRRVVPHRSYKNHRFPDPVTVFPEVPELKPSRDW